MKKLILFLLLSSFFTSCLQMDKPFVINRAAQASPDKCVYESINHQTAIFCSCQFTIGDTIKLTK